MPSEALLSTRNSVSVPIIIIKIGDHSFGLYNKTKTNIEISGKNYVASQITYPNYVKSLNVQKVNGTVNTYTLQLCYPITQNDDPNLIDKILSSISSSRKIVFTYGDGANPSFMYREEEALITDAQSQIDIRGSKINYTITAVSSSVIAASNSFNFPGYPSKKPSEIIKQILFNKTYGLQDIFYGMHDKKQIEQLNLIASDDREVRLEAKPNTTALNYLNYLVGCMSSINDSQNSFDKTASYVLTLHDDTSNVLSGPYFKISKVLSNVSLNNSMDYYTIDIGYPSKDMVIDFTIDDNQAYALLYNYASKTQRNDYIYRLGDTGEVNKIYSPSISNDNTRFKTNAIDKSWWSQVTQFPISATLKLKGLLRAALLMDYLRINIYFYGKKFNASGLYIITKQVDDISESGYTTTLSLTRIGEATYD